MISDPIKRDSYLQYTSISEKSCREEEDGTPMAGAGMNNDHFYCFYMFIVQAYKKNS